MSRLHKVDMVAVERKERVQQNIPVVVNAMVAAFGDGIEISKAFGYLVRKPKFFKTAFF